MAALQDITFGVSPRSSIIWSKRRVHAHCAPLSQALMAALHEISLG